MDNAHIVQTFALSYIILCERQINEYPSSLREP